MNYYRRYVGDYLRDTARLSMLEHGAYNLLLDYYYADEKPLPADKDELYLMVRAMRPDDRKAVDKVLRLFFTQEPDGFHQKRVDHEIAVSKTARGNGKGGGRPRTGIQTGDITGLETGIVTEEQTGQLTGILTGEGGGSGHPPTTNLQPPASNLQPPKRERASPSGSRLALDSLPEAWSEFAKQENPQADPGKTFEKFADYWRAQPGAKGRKSDWEATWRNWVRREVEFSPTQRNATPDYTAVFANMKD